MKYIEEMYSNLMDVPEDELNIVVEKDPFRLDMDRADIYNLDGESVRLYVKDGVTRKESRKLYKFGEGEVNDEYRKELNKKGYKFIVKAIDIALKKFSNRDLNDYEFCDYTKSNKSPVVLYAKGGKPIKIPNEVVTFLNDKGHGYNITELDKKFVRHNFPTSLKDLPSEKVYDIFIGDNNAEKFAVYQEYLSSLKRPVDLEEYGDEDVFKFIKYMHIKKYMKNFKMFDDMDKQFGFFDED